MFRALSLKKRSIEKFHGLIFTVHQMMMLSMGRSLLFINNQHFLKSKIGLGNGSNNYVELLSLKLLLCWALKKNCALQVFNDSLNIIIWFNDSQRCHNHTLLPILEEIFQLKQAFEFISCCHIYRERNSKEDIISKEGIRQHLGVWQVAEHLDGTIQN